MCLRRCQCLGNPAVLCGNVAAWRSGPRSSVAQAAWVRIVLRWHRGLIRADRVAPQIQRLGEGNRRACLQPSVADYITKPYEPSHAGSLGRVASWRMQLGGTADAGSKAPRSAPSALDVQFRRDSDLCAVYKDEVDGGGASEAGREVSVSHWIVDPGEGAGASSGDGCETCTN
jgi:hypothetical protein